MQTNLTDVLAKLSLKRTFSTSDIDAAFERAEENAHEKRAIDQAFRTLLDDIMERRAQPPIKWNIE